VSLQSLLTQQEKRSRNDGEAYYPKRRREICELVLTNQNPHKMLESDDITVLIGQFAKYFLDARPTGTAST
jgi:hypothetical protein